MSKPKVSEWVCTRLGDAGDYERHDSIAEAAEALQEAGVKGPVDIRTAGKAMYAPGYDGQNYISLFWGDVTTEHTRDLTEAEAKEMAGHFPPPGSKVDGAEHDPMGALYRAAIGVAMRFESGGFGDATPADRATLQALLTEWQRVRAS